MEKTIPNFKAKRKDNGLWARGSYFALHHNDTRDHIHHFIIPNGVPIPKDIPIGSVQVEIDPDTLTLVNESGEEMLMVSKKQVQKLIDKYTRHFTATSQQGYSHVAWSAQMDTLKALFGEDILKSETPTEPKYKVGDKVTAYNGYDSYIATIRNINSDKSGYIYDLGERVNDLVVWTSEKDLHPYTEPESRNLSQNIANYDKPNANPLNDMEEKELNLGELLKDSIGEKFFHPTYGEITLEKIDDNYLKFYIGCGCSLSTPKNISTKTGYVIYYPSEESFRQYPLDGFKAWSEWAENRKPKRWRAKEGELYYWLNCDWSVETGYESMSEEDNMLYNAGNYFQTEVEAEEVAEEILKVINAFHKRKEADQ